MSTPNGVVPTACFSPGDHQEVGFFARPGKKKKPGRPVLHGRPGWQSVCRCLQAEDLEVVVFRRARANAMAAAQRDRE